jgi:hypothetical protein
MNNGKKGSKVIVVRVIFDQVPTDPFASDPHALLCKPQIILVSEFVMVGGPDQVKAQTGASHVCRTFKATGEKTPKQCTMREVV